MTSPAQRYRLGDVSCTRIADIETFRMPAERMFAGVTQADLAAVEAAFGPGFTDVASGAIVLSFNAYVIDDGDRVVLVDPGVGDGKDRAQYAAWHQRQSDFLERLADAGYPADKIDFVISTHLHADHVGWNTTRANGGWHPTFRRATYLFVEPELAYWTDLQTQSGDVAVAYGSYADSVVPILEAGVGRLVPPDTEIARGVRLVHAPGHTPGTVVLEIARDAATAVLVGDVFHHPLQLIDPGRSTNFCVDPMLASLTRRSLLERYADSGALICPAHFIAPGVGRVVRARDEYRYVFEPAA